MKNKPSIDRLAHTDEEVLLDSIMENGSYLNDNEKEEENNKEIDDNSGNKIPTITVSHYFDNFSKMAEDKLYEIMEYRLNKILNCLKIVLKSENEWINLKDNKEFFEEKLAPKFSEIVSLFEGNVLFLETDQGIFLFNYFGSNTPTSDLDYGLYLLTDSESELNFFLSLIHI